MNRWCHTRVKTAVNKLFEQRQFVDCISEVENWDDKDVCFDNWFTSLSLISILKEHGVSNQNSQSRSSWKRFENQQKRHKTQRMWSYASVLREK